MLLYHASNFFASHAQLYFTCVGRVPALSVCAFVFLGTLPYGKDLLHIQATPCYFMFVRRVASLLVRRRAFVSACPLADVLTILLVASLVTGTWVCDCVPLLSC